MHTLPLHDPLPISHAPRRGAQEQRHRADAAGGPGDLTADHIRELARRAGFELAGGARARPPDDRARYHEWVAAGRAGRMGYLTDRRAAVRDDPRQLLASARSVISVGKLYQTPWPHSTRFHDTERAWISRYAWAKITTGC